MNFVKCGTGTINKSSRILSISSIILTIIGIIGYWVIFNQIQILALKPDLSNLKMFSILQLIFPLLYIIGTVFAFISLFIQKNKLALIAGLIPCVYSLVIIIKNIIMWINMDI